jgi:hypothetical protein
MCLLLITRKLVNAEHHPAGPAGRPLSVRDAATDNRCGHTHER